MIYSTPSKCEGREWKTNAGQNQSMTETFDSLKPNLPPFKARRQHQTTRNLFFSMCVFINCKSVFCTMQNSFAFFWYVISFSNMVLLLKNVQIFPLATGLSNTSIYLASRVQVTNQIARIRFAQTSPLL